ncbi:phage baseplate upper protein [Bacillus safensis]|uniref:phage baseplate upper protein n=1 Tax=Bacillus safensis TaxID=561879 RepID=UPI002FFDA6CA
MLAKNGALSFDVNAQTKRPINAAIQFSTQDINTARLSFKITKDGAPLPLSAVVGKLAMTMADGSRFIKDVALEDKTEGLAEYVLTAEEIRHYGPVKAELLLRYTNGQALSIHKFGFEVDRSLIDQDIVPIAEYYIDDFEALRTRVNELYDSVVATVQELEDKFSDLDNVETKDGAQAKVDTHANKTDIHVTAQKKSEWDAKETPTGAQAKVDAHASNAKLHVTDAERTSWNLKETTTGSQAKVDAHAGIKDIHTTAAEKGVWNNGQLSKITADNGIPLIYVRDVNDSILEKIIDNGLGVGTFYAVSNSKDLPPAMRTVRGIYHITDVVNNKGTFGWVSATDFANVTYHNYLNNGIWRGWRQVLTDNDLNSPWSQVSLINGTSQHNSVYPLKFCIRQNVLYLRGSFESIPPSETVIARFSQKPSANTVFGATTVGSYGSARMALTEDGSLRYDGLSANDATKVNRIEINAAIPLW